MKMLSGRGANINMRTRAEVRRILLMVVEKVIFFFIR
jgi:hypothetical protein